MTHTKEAAARVCRAFVEKMSALATAARHEKEECYCNPFSLYGESKCNAVRAWNEAASGARITRTMAVDHIALVTFPFVAQALHKCDGTPIDEAVNSIVERASSAWVEALEECEKKGIETRSDTASQRLRGFLFQADHWHHRLRSITLDGPMGGEAAETLALISRESLARTAILNALSVVMSMEIPPDGAPAEDD